MCAIVGILSSSNVHYEIYDALIVQQHRGQDAAGIVTSESDGTVHLKKDNGLVQDVLTEHDMLNMQGNMGIGHCRYPTAGCDSSKEAQPFFVTLNSQTVAIAHNGNTVNTEYIRQYLLEQYDKIPTTSSDTELLLHLFTQSLLQDNMKVGKEDLFKSVKEVISRTEGGYAVVMMIAGKGLLAFRDPNGIRPLCYGERKNENGNKEYMFASESVALETLGYNLVRDVKPGEAIYINSTGELSHKICSTKTAQIPCAFEYVYLARPDSVIDGVSVYEARLKMGGKLAEKIIDINPNHDIDVVMPIPESGRTAALQMALTLGVPYQEGFVKNRYIGRTFIMPGQTARKNAVRKKLNPIKHMFEGKNVLLVDDSIVRGNTSRKIIQLARNAGAKKVFFASAAPAVKFPNVYGIDMPTHNELIAHNKSYKEIEYALGADRVYYQSIEDLQQCIYELNPNLDGIETSCFNGNYIAGMVNDDYLKELSIRRPSLAKAYTPA
ncbi:MAG: amidophosphoribosyltransferase [Patescibacteria group bacterium]|nr:amidophosphoribosyltransferase [Patescibacteria group bacterium]